MACPSSSASSGSPAGRASARSWWSLAMPPRTSSRRSTSSACGSSAIRVRPMGCRARSGSGWRPSGRAPTRRSSSSATSRSSAPTSSPRSSPRRSRTAGRSSFPATATTGRSTRRSSSALRGRWRTGSPVTEGWVPSSGPTPSWSSRFPWTATTPTSTRRQTWPSSTGPTASGRTASRSTGSARSAMATSTLPGPRCSSPIRVGPTRTTPRSRPFVRWPDLVSAGSTWGPARAAMRCRSRWPSRPAR